MAVKSQPMGFLDRLAAGLAWLGRCGTTAVAVSILLGIVLPPLDALVRPFFPETVFLLLCLAFLRVDPGALRAQFARPWLLLAAATWTMLIVPVLVGVSLDAFGLFDRSPGLLLALMLNVVAPPIFSSPALAVLMGLNAAVTLALLLTCIAACADAGRRGLRRRCGPLDRRQGLGRAPGRAHRRAQRDRAVSLRRGAD